MECEDVSEDLEWEARRVAAAFGIAEWTLERSSICAIFRGHSLHSIPVRCLMRLSTQPLDLVAVDEGVDEASCWFEYTDGELGTQGELVDSDCSGAGVLLARGLFCLGIDVEDVWHQLNITFTAHEQLELRLSMPREFWPKA